MKHAGRKVYHLTGGLVLLSVYYLLGREPALLFYAALFIVVLAADVSRLLIPSWNRFLFTRFSSFLRRSEEHKLTGTPPYVLGVGLSLYLYAPQVATAAICFLAFGDVSATAVGERYGKTKIGQKSLEGTLAFIAAAAASGMLLSLSGVQLSPWSLAVGVLTAAAVELLSLPVNDNLTIPLVAGAVMQLALRLG